MVRVILCAFLCLSIVASSYKVVSADENNTANSNAVIDNCIATIYARIDFGEFAQLSPDVFNKAYRGYMNLRNAGKLNTGKQVITICDFDLPSSEPRMWVIDLAQNKVLFNTYVAHGEGSGDDYATTFSNNFNSHQSSLGFYITGETYDGEHGTSLRLNGMDEGFNDAAFDRGIVVHGAQYVCNKFVTEHQRLGHSWGCPAVPAKLSLPIIKAMQDSTCLFIYYPDTKYLSGAYWLNKKITRLPEGIVADNVLSQNTANSKYTEIQYSHNGKTMDSVVRIPEAN